MTTPLTEQLTMHGHLYLLAHDRDHDRVALSRRWLLGFALRAAMMTDLSLAGYLHDIDGTAHRSGTKFPSEPLLSEMLGTVDADQPQSWDTLIARHQASAVKSVSDQLTGQGWLRIRHRRILGLIPHRQLWLDDEMVVNLLAERVRATLRNAIDGRWVDERLLAIGLLGVLTELPAALPTAERIAHKERLTELTEQAPAPVRALTRAVKAICRELAIDGLTSLVAGGCSGCGGCGGCGG